MLRSISVLAIVCVVVFCLASPGQARLKGTLNFENVTSTNVIQTVSESSSNEKEVDFGDFDNDGDLDVVIANGQGDFGTRKNKLYRNDGGVMQEISGGSIIPGFTSADVSRNAFFRDYTGDGWLDILIVNDANTGGEGGRTKFYVNKQIDGVFDHFDEEGQVFIPFAVGTACSAVSIDFDGINGFDLYLGNYAGPAQDTMHLNNGNGFLTEVTDSHVPTENDYTVDVSSADLNGDGQIDLLRSDHGGSNSIYYNNNLNQGSGLGDYKYGADGNAGVFLLGEAGQNENSMEAADFDGDGRVDIYWVNRAGVSDKVLRNIGNDGDNMAMFEEVHLPPQVTDFKSVKATVMDLNHDGKIDVFVMGNDSRPTVLRNVSWDDHIAFVDWTPAPAFPNGSLHRGWHAAAFHVDDDEWEDIFLGGWNDDYLFRSVDSNEFDESELGGVLPAVYNLDPVAVSGTAAVGEPDTYEVAGLGSGFISVVLNGVDDLELDIFHTDGSLILKVDRGTFGVEEAIQLDTAGVGSIRVLVRESAGGDCEGDANGDGVVDPLDSGFVLARFGCPVNTGDPGCDAADQNWDGMVDPLDVGYVLARFGPCESEAGSYILEILARD